MNSFNGKIAVVTGGGDGMGRSLAIQLAREACHVAICDVNAASMAQTIEQCRSEAPAGTMFASALCDVSDEEQLETFRDVVRSEFDTDHVHLLINNAGIAGGGSMIVDERSTWERTFNVCWNGVYLGTRVFLPLLMAADESHIVNTSSINGFWASLGPERPHTAYSSAKFAVKGFTEALVQDLRLNAPHVHAHVVMPGHIGTGIAANSVTAHGIDVTEFPEISELTAAFRNSAPTSADSAASTILDAVLDGHWRILVGEDAHVLDMLVRDNPEKAYEPSFADGLRERGMLTGLIGE